MIPKFDFFEVGGCVRDKMLGIKSKDIDYSVVYNITLADPNTVFKELSEYLKQEGYEIFLETPDCFTIRARFPDNHPHKGTVADFVLARKETGYIPGTRQPISVIGTLHDDLERRDFTVNAMARNIHGQLIDPFNGKKDLEMKILKTPLPTEVTFNDDPLRILRAIRFCITKGFIMQPIIHATIQSFDYNNDFKVVSTERIREELFKCFSHNTLETLNYLNKFTALRNYCFKDNTLWLKPTMEQ